MMLRYLVEESDRDVL